MRKITDFIVKGRYVFLTLFIIMAGISLYLSTKVNINEDIMKYLPASSETKIGKDIMEKEFLEQDSSTLNVMFQNLTVKEKKETFEKLKKIEGVSSVDYENTEEYNKDKYTLYILNVNDYANSKTATNVYNYVEDNFKVVGMSGSIYEENKPILQLWIVILAIGCAMVILIILSESYVEPWLYLISIGIAVFINKGTNIIFSSVSSITNSIVAILQLALSMDYSIMLSNRYKQEKKTHTSKIEAMKEALYHSFKSILSSSVTTIVGLVALVFMSFTIGKDLGFVLAKGVLLSLISIFFCLPALLLIFDNLIAKTKKKAPKFNLAKLGNFIYKTRYLQAIFIIVLFIAAYFLKGNINILYTGSEQDKVGKVFPTINQVAIVYNNKYEELISSYCKKLEKDEKIDKTLCYSNTINEKLAYDELNKKFKDLGQDTEIDEYLIKIIYYNYYNQTENNKMTLNEFISFIKSDIYNNENFNKSLNKTTKDNIDLLENFTLESLINKQRTTKELANMLKMNEEDAKNILIYYNSKNIKTEISLENFINFMLNDVAKDAKYSKSLDAKTISKLKQLQNFVDLNKINKKMNSLELANLLGMDKNLIEQLFLFNKITTESNTKLTLNEFATFALEMANQNLYKDMFDEEVKASLTMLKTLSDEKIINTKLNQDTMKKSLASLGLNIDENTLSLLYIYYTGSNSNSKLTLNSFATTALKMSQEDSYKSYFKEETLKSLQSIILLNTYYDKKIPNNILYEIFEIDKDQSLKLNYLITNQSDGVYTISPFEFVNTLLETKEITASLNSNQLESLQMALYIMNNINTTYNIEDLSKALSQDRSIVSLIYGISDFESNNLKDISLKDLINFLYNNKSNPLLSSSIVSLGNNLEFAYPIVNNPTVKYTSKEISNITNTELAKVKQIFGVYDYNSNITTMIPLEFVNLILNNKDNNLLSGKISDASFKELSLVKEVIIGTLNKEKYTSFEVSSLLNIDNDTISLLFSLYDFKYIKANQELSLKEYIDFIIKNVMNNQDYAANFDNVKREKLTTINTLMNNSLNGVKYTANESFGLLYILSDDIDKSLIDLVYMYYGSNKEYDETWKMTIEEFVNYLNSDIITDKRFDDFINSLERETITNSKETVDKSKKLIVSDNYSRAILNTKYALEDKDTYKFIESVQEEVGNNDDIYIVGNSPMAVEMNKTFDKELNKITLLTMLFIFIVVAITFKDLIIPFVLVLIIQTAVYLTMSTISITGGSVYFISLLIVQAILMGATIDYAIVYTSYYRESRLTMGVKESVINAYNKSINTIISSSLILIIVTLVVAGFASLIAAKICETISEGTFASVILILFVLPGVLAATDKMICRKGYYKEKK